MYNQKDEKTLILKSASAAGGLFANKNYDKAINAAVATGNFIFGHNRAATKGKKVWADTHPFIEKHICLIHNGTLFNHEKLAKTSVDSNAIAVHLAKHPDEEDTISKIDGAFALIWADMEKKTLNLCRNSQRPLYLLDCDNVWIVSSEAELGAWIASRNNFKVNSTISLFPGTMYSFDMKEGDYTKYTEKKLSLFVQPKRTYVSPNYTNYDNSWDGFTYPENKSEPWWSKKKQDEAIYIPGKLWYHYQDKIHFTFDKENGTAVRKHPNFNYQCIIGKLVDSKTNHQVIINGSPLELSLYDKSPVTVWEAIVSSVVTSAVKDGHSSDMFYVKNMKPIEEKKQTQLVLVETKEDQTCCMCQSTIWKGKDLEEAMNCGSGQYICKTCQDDWKEDLPSLVTSIHQQCEC